MDLELTHRLDFRLLLIGLLCWLSVFVLFFLFSFERPVEFHATFGEFDRTFFLGIGTLLFGPRSALLADLYKADGRLLDYSGLIEVGFAIELIFSHYRLTLLLCHYRLTVLFCLGFVPLGVGGLVLLSADIG